LDIFEAVRAAIPASALELFLRSTEVASYMPGRVRLYSRQMIGNPALEEEVRRRLGALAELESVTTNMLQPIFGYLMDKRNFSPLLPYIVPAAAAPMCMVGFAGHIALGEVAVHVEYGIMPLIGRVKMRRIMLTVVIHTNDNSKEH